MPDLPRLRAVSRSLRPRLSEQAKRAQAVAGRLHARLRTALERKPGDLDEEQRLERNLLLLGSAGVLGLFTIWCGVHAVPVIEGDVEARVRSLLTRELAHTWVQTEVFGREVRLFGVAPSGPDRARIREAVGELAAVTRVHDHLIVALPPQQVARERSAASREKNAAQGLPRSLSIVFDGAQLRLVGEVGDAQTTTAVVRDAEQRFTAAAVVTELTLTATASERWRQAASAAITTSALLDVASVELRRRASDDSVRLTLTGITADITTLSAVRESLRQHAPGDIALQVDLVPIFRDGRVDPDACRSALALIVSTTTLAPDGDYTGLDRRTRLTLDQVSALVQGCGAGLVIAAPRQVQAGFATFADDLRSYLVAAGLRADLVAVARVAGQREPAQLQLVFQRTGEQEN